MRLAGGRGWRLLSILGAIVILADPARAREADAENLLKQAVAAQGSDSAIAAVRSLTAVADCTGPSGDYETFKTEVVSLLPDRTMFRQTAAGRTMELFVAGDKGWLRSSAEAPPQPLPEGLKGVVRGHEFHFLFLDLVQRNRDPRLSGRDTVEGKSCLVVKASDSGGRPTSVCIDEKTKLPLRVSFEPSGGPKPQTIHVPRAAGSRSRACAGSRGSRCARETRCSRTAIPRSAPTPSIRRCSRFLPD